METIITGLIEKLIIPKFGPLGYSVKTTDGDPFWVDAPGYIMEYYRIPESVDRFELNLETRFIIQMLGLESFNLSSAVKGKRMLYYIGGRV